MDFELGRPMGRQFRSLAQHINVSKAQKYPHCNSVIDKNSRFCNFYGQSAESKNWGKSVIKCSACGSKIKPGSKFCPECGTLLKE
ncbi:MAG: zinc-ribbon domain-containing protein [Lachnospiraceae bacterium]|nr:zinc-ribbon domain-containing protein [Lachnospiraceae bacterium]